ncbi:carboxymuconolactone decarboxylase family protein [soil metagenome]
MTTTTPRVPFVVPGTRAELADIEARITAERGRISPLYQVLLNSVPIASGWEQMLTAVRNQSSVPAELRELMILRVAVINGAEFEFTAHAPIAEKAGVSRAKIDALRETVLPDLYSVDERNVLALADAMTRDIVVPDALMVQLQQRFDSRALVEAVATVAAYNMVSRLLVALNVH